MRTSFKYILLAVVVVAAVVVVFDDNPLLSEKLFLLINLWIEQHKTDTGKQCVGVWVGVSECGCDKIRKRKSVRKS